jgi:hypothetical protein
LRTASALEPGLGNLIRKQVVIPQYYGKIISIATKYSDKI